MSDGEVPVFSTNRPFSYSTKESGSSDVFIHFHTRGSMALELLSVLCTSENSTKCKEISFDPHSFLE